MIKKIKEYFEYRKNKKIAKRALVKTMATVLPTVETIATKGSDIVQFVVNFVEEAKATDNNQLIEMVLNKTSEILNVEDNRIVEILSYMVSLQPEDIQKILVHSIVETNDAVREKTE